MVPFDATAISTAVADSPLLLACIPALATVVAALIGKRKKQPTNIDNSINGDIITNNISEQIQIGNYYNNQGTVNLMSKAPDPEASEQDAPFREQGRRLRRVCSLINEGCSQRGALNESGVARLLGEPSAERTYAYFSGKRCPDFAYLDAFASEFSVDMSWLDCSVAYGERVFAPSPIRYNDPSELYEDIIRTKPLHIHFILCDCEEHSANIILKYGEYNYQILTHPFILDLCHVGATGRGQIVGFVKLVRRLDEAGHPSYSCSIVCEDDWRALMDGRRWPGSIDRRASCRDPFWATDLCDVHHAYPISAGYEETYGTWFVDVQRYVSKHDDDS